MSTVTGRALYLVNGSISSIRVLIALHEQGLAFLARRLRVMREPRDTRTPAFLALNPRGQAPVLTSVGVSGFVSMSRADAGRTTTSRASSRFTSAIDARIRTGIVDFA